MTFSKLEKLTAPTEWPAEFDASALPPPTPEPREEMPSPERRKQLAAMLRAIVADMALTESRAPTWRNMTPAQANDRLGRLRGEYAEDPTVEPTTPEMSAYLERMREEEVADAF